MPRKQAIILSDHEALSRAIEVNLNVGLDLDVLCAPVETGEAAEGRRARSVAPVASEGPQTGPDLIVVAISATAGEPLLMLHRAALIERVGQVPLLIISDRRFVARPGENIVHLDFPFDARDLYHTVQMLLDGDPVPGADYGQ